MRDIRLENRLEKLLESFASDGVACRRRFVSLVVDMDGLRDRNAVRPEASYGSGATVLVTVIGESLL